LSLAEIHAALTYYYENQSPSTRRSPIVLRNPPPWLLVSPIPPSGARWLI
jgi:hypothetical protein